MRALNSEYCCPVLGLSKVHSTFDQLANLHSDTLRDLAPFLCMERSNRIPMEIFRLATRNENQWTNGRVNAHRGPDYLKKVILGFFGGVGTPPPPSSATIFYHFGWNPTRKNVWIRKSRSSKGHHFIKL